MQVHKSIALTGSLTFAWLFLLLTLPVTVRAIDSESLSVPTDSSGNVLAGPVYTIGHGNTTSSTLSCREGLAGWEPYLSEQIDTQQLGGGLYLNFQTRVPPAQPDSMEYVQIIRVNQNKTITGAYLPGYTTNPPLTDTAGGLGPVITDAPGSLWLVGNEPDRGPDIPGGPAQDDTYPQVYAQVYHDVYKFIKERDPSAQVAVAGLVEVTPGRMQYLDIVWDTYLELYGTPMPVDVWNMHIYILPEVRGIAGVALGTDPALVYTHTWEHTLGESNAYTYGDHDNLTVFDSQVRRMRQWMKDHGQQDKPLLLSEFGLLYDEDVTDEFEQTFTVTRATTFLANTFNYLTTTGDAALGMPSDRNRLVQQWIWFSVNNNLGHISDLMTDYVTGTLPVTFTPVGQMFKANVASRPLASNLLPRATSAYAPPGTPTNPNVTATLSVELVNNGNRLIAAPLTVTFYTDAALTQAVSSVVITGGVPGCARRRITTSAVWSNLEIGLHLYWAKVDSTNVIFESNEADNVIPGQIFVGTLGVYLPLLVRN